MLFKSKDDQESIERAQQMYGAGINRGLAGFVSQNRKKKSQAAKAYNNEIVVTTTEKIPENHYRIIGAVYATVTQKEAFPAHEQAINQLREAARKAGADVVVAMRFDSTSSTVTAYGTAVKLSR